MTNYGDLSYLLRSNYEAAMRSLILQATMVSMRDLRLYDEPSRDSKPYASDKRRFQVGLRSLPLHLTMRISPVVT